MQASYRLQKKEKKKDGNWISYENLIYVTADECWQLFSTLAILCLSLFSISSSFGDGKEVLVNSGLTIMLSLYLTVDCFTLRHAQTRREHIYIYT